MKINKKIYYILMFLPIIATIVSFIFLPEKIPVHYNNEMIIDRWGIKFETLILPIAIIPFGASMIYFAKKQVIKKNQWRFFQ